MRILRILITYHASITSLSQDVLSQEAIASYIAKPSLGHIQAAKCVLHYIHSTHDMGNCFTLAVAAPMHTYVHFLDSWAIAEIAGRAN